MTLIEVIQWLAFAVLLGLPVVALYIAWAIWQDYRRLKRYTEGTIEDAAWQNEIERKLREQWLKEKR